MKRISVVCVIGYLSIEFVNSQLITFNYFLYVHVRTTNISARGMSLFGNGC